METLSEEDEPARVVVVSVQVPVVEVELVIVGLEVERVIGLPPLVAFFHPHAPERYGLTCAKQYLS